MGKPAIDYAAIAGVYDLYVDTDVDVPFFLDECRNVARVLELTSGTGRLSLPLAAAGVRLTCVDSAREMLVLLRQKLSSAGLDAEVIEMDVCRLEIDGEFDRILFPFHAFAELLEPHDQEQALRGVERILSARGRFICVLHNPPARLKALGESSRPVSVIRLPPGQGSLTLSFVHKYDPSTRIVSGHQFYERYDASGLMQWKRLVDIGFRLHDRGEFQALVESAGFRVVDLFGDYSRAPFEERSPLMIWVLERAK